MDQESILVFTKLLAKYFDVKEINSLIYYAGENYDEIEGSTRSSKAIETVGYFYRRNKLKNLVELAIQTRPNNSWPSFEIEFRPETAKSKYAKTSNQDLIADDQHQKSLNKYLEQISNLILGHDLKPNGDDRIIKLARRLTIVALRDLDSGRNRQIIQFLKESDLLSDKCISFDRADLSGVNLEKANLIEVNFQSANLNFANLKDSTLDNAIFSGASIEYANLEGANFYGVNLSAAKLNHSNLNGSSFAKSDLSYAKINSAQAQKSGFQNANLNQTDFSHSNISTTSFYRARLGQTKFNETTLDGCNFYAMSLEGIDFTGASLVNTCFEGADLVGAIVTEEQLEEADLDRWTRMPNGILRNDMDEYQ